MNETRPSPTVQRLQLLLARRDHAKFLAAFEDIPTRGDDFLGALGGEGLCLLLDGQEAPSYELANQYGNLLLNRSIVAPSETIRQLAALLHSDALAELALLKETTHLRRSSTHPGETRGMGDPLSGPPPPPVLHVRRVIQTMQVFLGDGRFTDSSGICRSVFRSQQERTFLRALSLRFPGLLALPNYPLDQIVALDRVGRMNAKTLRYGRNCRLDAVLIIPDEGDPVAVFELDSRIHDQPEATDRDTMKNALIAATGLPFFRLRVESPESMTTDEWYALLSDQILPHLDLGARIRCRKVAYNLIPC